MKKAIKKKWHATPACRVACSRRVEKNSREVIHKMQETPLHKTRPSEGTEGRHTTLAKDAELSFSFFLVMFSY